MRPLGFSAMKLENWCLIRCLPEQHEENRKIKTIVQTGLDPAVHVHSANHVNFKDGFFAVDEAKQQVKAGESVTAK